MHFIVGQNHDIKNTFRQKPVDTSSVLLQQDSNTSCMKATFLGLSKMWNGGTLAWEKEHNIMYVAYLCWSAIARNWAPISAKKAHTPR